jgi:Sulfatase
MINQPLKTRAGQIGKFFALLERENILLAFLAALVVMDAAYRVELASIIYSGVSKLESLQPSQVPPVAFIKSLLDDLILMALLGLCYLGFKLRLRLKLPRVADWRYFPKVEAILAAGVLLFIALIMRIHFQLLVQLETGLSITFARLSPQMFSQHDFFQMMTRSDFIFFAAPMAVFFLALIFEELVRKIYKPAGIALILLIVAAQFLPGKTELPSEIARTPLIYFLDDTIRLEVNKSFHKQDDYDSRREPPHAAQINSIRLVDPAFVNTNTQVFPAMRPRAMDPDGRPWNILIFVLESTGADYVFDGSQADHPPMPFLKKVSREGLYLSDHFAAANISARAAFSIFTGIYPPPNPRTLCMEQDLIIPTFNRFLGPGYDYFFIHPTSASYWFPQFLFLNNKLEELDTMHTMPPGARTNRTEEARNEIDCFDFLQARLDRAKEPFLGVYWSYIAHYPYSDYGVNFRIRTDLSNARDRYYNNLRTLDDQIQLVCEHLRQTKMADRTLFVFIGDHGEAFGQHRNVWGHALGSYSEMYRVPVVIWQPKLIQPQVIKFPTSHVDIVPTLLDLLGLPYDPSRFQGDSVLHGAPNRKYIFTMDGYADYISAISQDNKKVSLCFNHDDATAFDLAKDPGEKFPLNEYAFSDAVEAILKFRGFQSQMVPDYNKALLLGSNYPPQIPSGTPTGIKSAP